MPNLETQPFWDAVERGQLLLKHCATCDKPHHYPRSLCPFCFGAQTAWTEASGRGRIYAFSVARRATPVYVVAYVQLDEGPMLLSHVVDCEPDDVHIGLAVEVIFQPDLQAQLRPVFRPLTP